MIFALLWKEAREHRPKLLLISALLALFFLPLLFWENLNLDFRDLTIGFFLPTCWLLPIWMAAHTVTSEKSQRTARLLSAMPLPTSKIFRIKTIVALLTILLPMSLLILLLASRQNSFFTPNQWLGMLVGIASLYLMTVALTATLQRETAVAMAGVLIALLSLLWILALQSLPQITLRNYLIAFDPFTPFLYSFIYNHDLSTTYSPHFVQLIMVAFWWTIALLRYNTSPKLRPTQSGVDALVGRTNPPSPSKKLPPPRSLFHSLLWRECREQGWVILTAAFLGLLFAAGVALLTTRSSGYSPTSKLPDMAHMFAQCALSLSIFIPAIVAIILGIGSWATDLHPKLFDFWRSRPISPAALLWSKFLISFLGILALMTTFALASLAATAYASSHGLNMNQFTDITDLFDLYITVPIALTAILASTITITLLIRRPIVAGITALLLVILTTFATTKLNEPSSNVSLHQIQTDLVLATIIALTLSHLALTRNWQLKPNIH